MYFRAFFGVVPATCQPWEGDFSDDPNEAALVDWAFRFSFSVLRLIEISPTNILSRPSPKTAGEIIPSSCPASSWPASPACPRPPGNSTRAPTYRTNRRRMAVISRSGYVLRSPRRPCDRGPDREDPCRRRKPPLRRGMTRIGRGGSPCSHSPQSCGIDASCVNALC